MEKSSTTNPSAVGGLFSYFSKTTNKAEKERSSLETGRGAVVKKIANTNLCDRIDEGESDIDSENVEPENDKENMKNKSNKLVIKIKNAGGVKKKRKKVESSDDEVLEEIINKKKKSKKSEDDLSPSISNFKVEEVTSKSDDTIDLSDSEFESLNSPNTASSSSKPKNPISSFFTKVTKQERLSKVEHESIKVEVKALVHESPEEKKCVIECKKEKPIKSSKKLKLRLKSLKSNVSRSAAETEKIDVIDVDEISDETEQKDKVQVVENEEEGPVEIELDTAAPADEAVSKISNSLFKIKAKRRSQEYKDDSDNSVNMESLENTPVKNSPVKKAPKLQSQGFNSAFKVLMSKKKIRNDIDETEDSRAAESMDEKILKVEKESEKENEKKSGESFNNAFATLMKNSRRSFEPPPPDPDDTPDVLDNTGKGEEPVISRKTSDTVNNAFMKLMKGSKNAIQPEDDKLRNMLSALHSVDSEDEEELDKEVQDVFNRSSKGKRKKKKRSSGPFKDTQNSSDEDDAQVFDIRCKATTGKFHISKFKSGGEGKCIFSNDDWYTPNEFEKVSGSRAKKYKVSLFVNNRPIIKLLEARNVHTPSRCDTRSGRSSAASDVSGGRRTPLESPSMCRTPTSVKRGKGMRKKILQAEPLVEEVVLNDTSPEDQEVVEIKDEQVELESEANVPEVQVVSETVEATPGRRSGRIARNAANIAEKKKLAAEQELALEAAEKKVEAERKARNAAVKKQREMLEAKARQSQESSSSGSDFDPDSDSECRVEKVVMGKTGKQPAGKLASIFSKKTVKPAEDPAVVAARKAFLMSSAPDTLRTQKSLDESQDPDADDGCWVWPGPDTCPSHVQGEGDDTCAGVATSPGPWSFADIHTSGIHAARVQSGDLGVIRGDEAILEDRCHVRLSEADVLATMETKSARLKKRFSSLMERKLEAEMYEKEAMEKNLSVAEVEEKRIRGNRRRSRRSRELSGEAAKVKYTVDSGSGLVWASKYQPRCGADLLGNKAEIESLRDWLSAWSGARRASNSGSSSDVSSEDLATDSEYEAEVDGPGGLANTALIEGPPGAGKTAAVYALAAEMGFNVLEVNAASNRTGRQVLSMLAEATQSQQVRGGVDSGKQGNMFASKGIAKEDKNGNKKVKLHKTALILFEDIDLVFGDLDDGFYNAVNTLSQQSKRPIVMTTSNTAWMSPGVSSIGERSLRFTPKVFYLGVVPSSELVEHLQMVALVEGFHVSKADLKRTFTKTDVRKALLQLQLLCGSGVGNDTEAEEDEDDAGGEDAVDIRKWFRHLDARSRRAGVAAPVSGLRGHEVTDSPEYSSRQWWASLPGPSQPPPARVWRYPLRLEDVPRTVFSRIDPLKNKELFDNEDSNDESVEEDTKVSSQDPPRAAQPEVSQEERARHQASLALLADHLDTVATWGREEDTPGWHLLHTELPSPGTDAAAAECGDLVLRRSADRVAGSLGEQEWAGLRDPDPDTAASSQQHAFYSGLVDIFLTDTRGRLDLLAGLRTLARGEELRRLQAGTESRRGHRFSHYFSQCEADIEEGVLINLCNALQD